MDHSLHDRELSDEDLVAFEAKHPFSLLFVWKTGEYLTYNLT